MNARHALPALFASLLLPVPSFGQEEQKLPVIEAMSVDLGRPVDFPTDVLPILEQNCIACHNLAIDEGKLSLEDVEGILKGGKRGPAVVPGKPDESRLFTFTSRMQNPVMPPPDNKVDAVPLAPRELGIIRKWIEEGAKSGAGTGDAAVVWSPLPANLVPVYALALSPWAETIAVGRANRVHLYDTATAGEIAVLADPALAALQADGKPVYGPGVAHRDFVHAIAFAPDGNRLATAGYRVVKIWERVERARLAQQPAGGPVTTVAVSADGKWAAFGSEDRQIRVWNLAEDKLAHTLAGHEGSVTGLAFDGEAKRLVSGSKDKTIRVWNLADGQAVAKLDLPAESNDLCLTGDGTHVVSADADNKLRVWAVPTEPPAEPKEGEMVEPPKPVRELNGHGGPVTSVRLVAKGPQVVSGSQDGTIRLWDANNGNQARSMNHGGPVTAVAANADGQQVASAGENGTAKIWNATNGQQIAETAKRAEESRTVVRLTDVQTVAKQKVALADAAQKAAEQNVADRKKALEEAEKAKPEADKKLAEIEPKVTEAEKKLDEAKKALAEKPEEGGLKKAVEDAQNELQKQRDELTKAKSAKEAADRAVDLAKKSVGTAEAGLEERKQAKNSADERQKGVDAELETAKKVEGEAPAPLRAIAFTPTGALVTAGDDNRVSIWSTGGTLVARLVAQQGAVRSLAVLDDGRIVAGSADNTAVVWAANDEWKLAATLGPAGDDPMNVASSRFAARVLALAFSPDGTLLATGGGEPSRSGELLLWNVEKRDVAREFPDAHSDTVFDLEFSRDGKRLVSGAADKFIRLFDVEAGTLVRSYEGHTHHVLGVAFKADDSELVSGGADNQIKVWDLETGEQKRTVSNHAKEVTSIDYIGVGENTISSGGDMTVRLHRTSNGQNYRTLSGNTDFVYVAVASRDEELVVSGGADGVVRLWNKNGQLLRSIEPPKPPDEAAATAAN